MSVLAHSSLSHPFRLSTVRSERNLSVFVLKISSLKSYAVSRNVKLRVSANLPRRYRRNTLREKFVAREVQVPDIPKSPTIDESSGFDHQYSTEMETGGAGGSHDSDLTVEEIGESSSQDGDPEKNAVDSAETLDLPGESAPWNDLANWLEQYKKDSEFWGIGSGPIFTVHRDSTGAITKVAVNEDEIVRRSGASTFSHHQGDKMDLDVTEKVSRVQAIAKSILSGEYIVPKNSSIVKYEDAKFSFSFIRHFDTVIPLGKTVLKSSPEIAFALICGYLIFWAAKDILIVPDSSELTGEEKEMLRRKLKARKQVAAREKGSVEVIQDEEPQQIASVRKPMLDKDELVKEIAKAKTLTHVKPGLPDISSTRDATFDEKIKEIKEMARKARDSERQELQKNSEVKDNLSSTADSQNETAKTDGRLDKVIDTPQNKVQDNFLSPKENNVQEGFASPTADSPNQTAKTAGVLNNVVGTPTNLSSGSQHIEVECSIPQKLSAPCEPSGDLSNTPKAASLSSGPNNRKHKLIRSVKEAREYLTRKNKTHQVGLPSHVNENCGSEPGHGKDESAHGKNNQKKGKTNKPAESHEGDISRCTSSQNLGSDSYFTVSKTKSAMDESVTEGSTSPVSRNCDLLFGKPNADNFINGSGNTSPKDMYDNRATTNSSIQAVSVDSDNKRLNEGSISEESDSTENGEPHKQKMISKSIQVDDEGFNAASSRFINGNGSLELNEEPMVLNSADFSGIPSMNKDVTEKQGVDGLSSVFSPGLDGFSEELSSTSDNASINMKNEKDFREVIKESNGADPPKDSKSSSKTNWLEENFQEFQPVVEKIGSGFSANYMTAKVRAEENTIAKAEISDLDLFDIDDEFGWMKDEKLKEIVFQVRENELAGRNPFYLINDNDRAAFFKGLEKKADKLNSKLLSLHEWIHSRIENIDYGKDGISLYDPPEKVIPRWKNPAVDKYPEFLNKPANAKSDSIELDKSSCDTSDKLKNSEELGGLSSSSHDIRNKSESNISSRQKTVIECSDGTSRAGKKGSNEQWQHTKKWSREFLEIYNSETDPEMKSIMKDMGKDLDRWITQGEIQDAADLMKRIPAKKRRSIEKKLAKLAREVEMFGSQAVFSKYKEYSDEVEEDYFWWLDLKYVLLIELYTVEKDVQKIGFYSLEMAADLDLNPKQRHVIGFEDPGDSKNFCYIVQAHLEMLGTGSAFVVARLPKDAFQEAKGNGFNVTVIRKGELKLNIDQPLEEVEEEIIEIGSKMYHDKIMRERGVNLNAVMKGFLSYKSSKG